MQQNEHRLIEELRHLSPERRAQAERFVLFLRQEDQQEQVRQSYARASEEAFAEIWNNEEDAIYDTL